MSRNEVIKIIISELSLSKNISYTNTGGVTMLSDSVISLDFIAKSYDFRGSVNFYSREYDVFPIKAQYDNHSEIENNANAKRRIDVDINRINEIICDLNN